MKDTLHLAKINQGIIVPKHVNANRKGQDNGKNAKSVASIFGTYHHNTSNIPVRVNAEEFLDPIELQKLANSVDPNTQLDQSNQHHDFVHDAIILTLRLVYFC